MNNALFRWPVLEKVELYNHDLNLTGLINLKELWLCDANSQAELDVISKDLIELEKLQYEESSIARILPFIRHCKKLKIIEIAAFYSSFLDLITLNQERVSFGEDNAEILIYLPILKLYLREK